jgi:primosomal protein N' (replication factor Y)
MGNSSRCGILFTVSDVSELPLERLKSVNEYLDDKPLLNEEALAFAAWSARYYQHPLGDALFHVLPVSLRKCKKTLKGNLKGWRLTPEGAAIDLAQLKQAHRQAEVLRLLSARTLGMTHQELVDNSGVSSAVLRSLRQKNWITACSITPDKKIKIGDTQQETGPPLNQAQREAVEAIGFNGFATYLLEGVTGSGKTEVYLCLIEQNLQQNRQTLVLVPEIGLTPQLINRFRKRLGIDISVLHSGLSDLERERQWFAASSGRSRVVVGTRSAIFTPLPELGLILVDEEHDLSFKQQEGFRYSARDLAVVRANRQGCPIVLGSATPSLESLRNIQMQRYRHLLLPERAGKAAKPQMDLIDIRSNPLKSGISPVLIRIIGEHLARDEQVLLFLNRRGFSPLLICHACGWLSDCPRCDARMTFHRSSHILWCHHCGSQQAQPETCPACGCPDLHALGQGTERLESSLAKLFPNTPIARVDRDSTRRSGELEKLLEGITNGDYPLLIGTQMLAKGHHFPHVTLVALIDVDQGLFGVDYRASERMAQLIVQVAGRAGRAEKPGRVVIQTHHPDHPLLNILVSQGYAAFAAECLQERQSASLPPYSYQCLLRAESTQAANTLEFLEQALKLAKSSTHSAKLEFWGPVPAPMEKRAGRIRAHLLIQAANRGVLQGWLDEWTPALASLPSANRVRWSLDVDPQEML